MKYYYNISIVPFTIILTANLNGQTFEIVKDINPSGDGKPTNLLAMDNYLFFVADFNDGHAIRLAKTDGTTGCNTIGGKNIP